MPKKWQVFPSIVNYWSYFLSSISRQVFERCIVRSVDFSSPVPDAIYAVVANAWQDMILWQRVGLCNNLAYGELKQISLESGTVA